MKKSFFGYYKPSEEEYNILWKEALIVVDTNVLLSLYRLPAIARNELLSIFYSLKGRLWIPNQVALEFHRSRLSVIANERGSIEKTLDRVKVLVGEVRAAVDSLQIDKRGLGIETSPLLGDLSNAEEKIVKAIEAVHERQIDISSPDPFRDRIDEVFCEKVGAGPRDQKELDEMVKDGEDRYQNKIPPGFMDDDKGRNGKDPFFFHDGIKFPKKFGDLIIWRQLLKYVESEGLKNVLLITGDRKEDWWWKEQGKIIGPQPSLIREMCAKAGVDLFWMYSMDQFMQHAKKYSGAKVSAQSVLEAEKASMSLESLINLVGKDHVQRSLSSVANRAIDGRYMRISPFARREDELNAVARWLYSSGVVPEVNIGEFPEIVCRTPNGPHGYEVNFVYDFVRNFLSPQVVDSMKRGCSELKDGRLKDFTMVVLIDEYDFTAIMGSSIYPRLEEYVESFLAAYPVVELIIGCAARNHFEVALRYKRPDSVFMV